MRQFRMKPVTALIGSAFVASLASASFADTLGNPFEARELPSGYQLLADSAAEAKEAEGKCGEGKCGEGQCGGAAGEDKSADDKDAEGKCGEGKCGEGKCGEARS